MDKLHMQIQQSFSLLSIQFKLFLKGHDELETNVFFQVELRCCEQSTQQEYLKHQSYIDFPTHTAVSHSYPWEIGQPHHTMHISPLIPGTNSLDLI